MIKINKKLILITILVLMVGVLGGCSEEKNVEFDHVTNKKLTKDLNDIRNLALESMTNGEYDEDIDDLIEEIYSAKYFEDLTDIEIVLVNQLDEIKDTFKNDLTNNNGIIDSYTYEDMNWLLQLVSEDDL